MVQVNYFQDKYLPNVRITSQSSDSGSDTQSFFQWELDKPTASFNKAPDQLIFEGIEQFAKMTTSSNEFKTLLAVNNLVQGKGAIGALTPFAIPYVIGKGIQAVENYQQNKRTQAVRQATQQGINAVTKKGGYGYDDAYINYAPPSGGDSGGGWSGGSSDNWGGGFDSSQATL
jgi:hypothetical protein